MYDEYNIKSGNCDELFLINLNNYTDNPTFKSPQWNEGPGRVG